MASDRKFFLPKASKRLLSEDISENCGLYRRKCLFAVRYLHYFRFLYNGIIGGGCELDRTDHQILKCLKENARENATNIGAKINLSTSAVIERIRKFEASGLIKQYTIVLDQNKVGGELMAFISVRLEHPKYYENFVELINAHSSIAECYYIAGDFDFMVKIITKNGQSLEDILNYIKSIEGVSLTRTSVVLSTNKNEVCMLPDFEK